jgi:hypothetical protein
MPTETIILLENFATDSLTLDFSYSEKQPGAGYHRLESNLHTAFYKVDSFEGTIKMQGTLALDPNDNDWFDIVDTEFGGDSTISGGTTTTGINFTGNFVWIRAAYNVQSGSISSIQYNF